MFRFLSLAKDLPMRCLMAVVAIGLLAPVVAAEVKLGQPVGDFQLKDTLGQPIRLSELGSGKPVVVAFVGTQCPLVQLYGPRLVELAKKFEPQGVKFIGIDSNRQDSLAELAQFAKQQEWTFPIARDPGNAVADQFGAERTPQVFVVDGEGIVRYSGRIDDQYGFRGDTNAAFRRLKPSRDDLAEALTDLLAGREVRLAATDVDGCRIGRMREADAKAEVTYARHVAGILNKHCVYCHRDGQIAPFALANYEDAAGWADMIREVTQERRMPPWHADPRYGHFANDARLSEEELSLLDRWVAAGAPEGDPAELPEPPKFTDGWLIPEPEQVVYMGDKAYDVPAEGVVEYQSFVVDPGWKEDRYIKAVEARPGNHAVVHHILVFVRPPEGYRGGGMGRVRGEWLAAFAPGFRPAVLPEGEARFVPAGSKLIFQMHYTPNGKAQSDRSYAGFVFADPKTVKKEVIVSSAGNYAFAIPPGADNHSVAGEFTFGREHLLVSLMPHMHLRGKSFRFEAEYPDKTKEVLLDVPKYDFGWQTSYVLAEPKRMPAGTKLKAIAAFDNSAENPSNPDPTKTVRFGEQTFDEMMIGFFEASPVIDLAQANDPTFRTKTSVGVLEATGGELDETGMMAVREALSDPEKFEYLGYITERMCPQIDRGCITSVVDGKLRLHRCEEANDFHSVFRATSTSMPAEGQALAEYAAGGKTVVNNDLSQAPGSLMKKLNAKGLKSSVHIPIKTSEFDGTINFWSTDPEAFPPPVVKFLEHVVALMAEGK